MAQPLPTELLRLAEDIADAVEPLADHPLAFFGHSMGAAVALETARFLEARGMRPAHLFASGSRDGECPPAQAAEEDPSGISSVPPPRPPAPARCQLPGDPAQFDKRVRRSRVAAGGRPGPVETAIRARHVHDTGMLMRAAAIDNAARQLMIQAESAAPSSPETPPPARRSAGDPAQAAAQSFPRDTPAGPAAAQPPGPVMRARPGSRVPRRS